MEPNMAEKYRLQYLLLVKEFISEVEKGTEWIDLKPILQEMKKVDNCLECLDAIISSLPVSNSFLPAITQKTG